MGKLIEQPQLDAVLKFICEQAKRTPAVERIWLFGSRAKGTFSPTSDYDLAFQWNDALSGGPSQSQRSWGAFAMDLREGNPALITLDLARMDQIGSELKNRILSEGVIIYEKI